MDKMEPLVEKVCSLPFYRRVKMAKQLAYEYGRTIKTSRKYKCCLESMAQKDIVAASAAAGHEGRHFIGEYLSANSSLLLDNTYLICCLLLGLDQDLEEYMQEKRMVLTIENVKLAIADVRRVTGDEILVLKFLRCLNSVDCKVDYIDDVFLDCPIDTEEFLRQEQIFCQEVFKRQHFEILYEYLMSRDRLGKIETILREDWATIQSELKGAPCVGSTLILLYFASKGNIDSVQDIIQSLQNAKMDFRMQKLCILLCCMAACENAKCVPSRIAQMLPAIKCDTEILMQYRKYIGNQEIKCFKQLLGNGKMLLEFLQLLKDNNTFAENFDHTIKPIESKNRKYIADNKHFSELLEQLDYTKEEREFIKMNTHIRVYA